MTPYFDYAQVIQYCGDSLELLPQVEAESVDLIFADPPYNIGKAAWDIAGSITGR